MDAESLRDTVGTALYDRIMQWNDSGAAQALQAAEQRQKAKEIKKPCWVPKLKNDLYTGSVDWGTQESEEVCNMPKSAVAFAEELHGEPCDKDELSPQSVESAESKENFCIEKPAPDVWDNGPVLNTSIDVPLMVDAVLERSADGLRLLVGGCPVEPSGWDDMDSELPDAPCLVEAVLEEFEDGLRLLVGGWPVQPSWDELDTNWSQLGWDAHKPKYGDVDCMDNFSGRRTQCFSKWYPGWQDSSWCLGKLGNSFSRGEYYTTAF